jgi:predicted house-cleaning noncanonical NTP pyrophosphatase (MazG superfamily)
MALTTVESRGALQDVIAENAAQDPTYREALINDPRTVLEKHLGSELPDWLKVEVAEERADTIYLIAPYVPTEELSDEDLEMVAGGKGKGGGGSSGPSSVNCTRNYGAFNSNITINSSVSLV